MSGLSFDQICDPTSMFQDTFSLSEFILGHQEDDSMESSERIKEEIDSEGEYHDKVKNSYYKVNVPFKHHVHSFIQNCRLTSLFKTVLEQHTYGLTMFTYLYSPLHL